MRLVFIPFKRQNSADHIGSTLTPPFHEMGFSEAWKGVTDQNLVCGDDPDIQTKFAMLSGAGDTLYIRGHGAAGKDRLESADHLKWISSATLVKYMHGYLDQSFAGTIKVFACQSAADIVNGDSFTQRFADKMWNGFVVQDSQGSWTTKTFRQCQFQGYIEKLQTDRTPSTQGGTDFHKWASNTRKDFATYRPISQSTMFLYEDGDSLLIDFRIRGDTLYLRQVGTDEEYHAMRVRK